MFDQRFSVSMSLMVLILFCPGDAPGADTEGDAPPLAASENVEGGDSSESLLTRAESQLEEGHGEEAARLAREFLQKDSTSVEAELLLGRALLAQEQFRDSIRHLRRAQVMDPENPAILYYLGNAYDHSKRTDEAITAYRSSLELNPDFAPTHYYLGHLLYYEKEDRENAVRHWQRATELDSENGMYFKYLGVGYAYLAQFARAKTALLRAQELEPNDFQITSMLEWMEQNLNIVDEPDS